jgi:hypothetical protein
MMLELLEGLLVRIRCRVRVIMLCLLTLKTHFIRKQAVLNDSKTSLLFRLLMILAKVNTFRVSLGTTR